MVISACVAVCRQPLAFPLLLAPAIAAVLFVVAGIVRSRLSPAIFSLRRRLLDRRWCRRWAGIISHGHDAPRKAIDGDVVVFGVYLDGVQGWQRESKGEGKQRNIEILSAGDQKNANSPPAQSWNRTRETNNLT